MSTLQLTQFDDTEACYVSPSAGARAANDPPFDVDTPDAAPAAAAEQQPNEAKPSPTALALVEVNKNIAEFDAVEAGLQALEKKYGKVIFGDIQTPKGLRAAKEARAEVRKPRYAAQYAITNAKGPLNTLKAAIAMRGEAIIARITAVEDPIDAQVKAEEKRLADERARLEREAAERKKAIDESIAEITSRVEACMGQPAAFMAETIAWLDNTEVLEEDFGDRTEEARAAWKSTRDRLVFMHAQTEAQEVLAAQLKAQQEEIARQKAELELRQKIADRIDAMRSLPLVMVEASAEKLRQALVVLGDLNPDDFGSRINEARGVAAQVVPELAALLDAALQEEADARQEAAYEPAAPSLPSLEARLDADDAEEAAAPAPEPEPVPAPDPVPAPVQPVAAAPARAVRREFRPTDGQLIEVLTLHFRVHESKVIEWLLAMDLEAASKRLLDGDVPF